MLSRYFCEICSFSDISFSGTYSSELCSARNTITRRAYLPFEEIIIRLFSNPLFYQDDIPIYLLCQ